MCTDDCYYKKLFNDQKELWERAWGKVPQDIRHRIMDEIISEDLELVYAEVE